MVTLRNLWGAAVLAFAALSTTTAADDDKTLQYEVMPHSSIASAMMMALANEDTVFILDKAENNRQKIAGRPVWASFVNLSDFSVRGVEAKTNPFCAAGGTLGNGSWAVVGGNQPVSYGGAASPYGKNAYHVADGRSTVRLLEPTDDSHELKWIDEPNGTNKMDSPRWYPGIEVLADGTLVLIGGATNGGFINRNTPNIDPLYASGQKNPKKNQWEQGGANPSYEFWPPQNKPKPQVSEFMKRTSGLNMYAHTYLMPSGKIFMQANYSTILWDYMKNKEEDLPDMPHKVVRVYPASGATAMKPLTSKNKFTPTILFCGGTYMTDEQWGNYTGPNVNTYNIDASKNCASITPETHDGKKVENVKYVEEDDLPEGRSMGQFIHLPNGKMVIVNGASKGVAGYGNTTWNTIDVDGKKVLLEGLAQEPTYRPVVYDPEQPKGKRLEYKDNGSSKIARLYHSSAVLIPDGSVLVAGSNCHQDVAITMPKDTKNKYEAFNTTYEIERWYPDYFFKPRPEPQNLPSLIKYGGDTFNFTMDAKFMGNAVNDLAKKTKVMVIRPGFSTHAMNMGQRSLQLDHTFQVKDDGSVEYMVNPMPTNMNIFVPGPALLFVTINGVPSKGKLISIGGTPKDIGNVPNTLKPGDEPKPLPDPVTNSKFTGTAAKLGNEESSNGDLSGGAIAGIVVGVVAAAAIIAALLAFLIIRNKRRGLNGNEKQYIPMNNNGTGAVNAGAPSTRASGYGGVPPGGTPGNVDASNVTFYNNTAEVNSRTNLHDPNEDIHEPAADYAGYNSNYNADYNTNYFAHSSVGRGDIETPPPTTYTLPKAAPTSSTIVSVNQPVSESQASLRQFTPAETTSRAYQAPSEMSSTNHSTYHSAYHAPSAMSSYNHSTYHSAYHSMAHSDMDSEQSQSLTGNVPYNTTENAPVVPSNSNGPYLQSEPSQRASGGIMGPRAMPTSNLQLHLQNAKSA